MQNHGLSQEIIDVLIREAEIARGNAYTPHSHYLVGAALLTEDEAHDGTGRIAKGTAGEIIRGCNIENASFGVTNCAERSALFAAVAQGHRAFRAIAIVAGAEDEVNYPRGGAYTGDPSALDYPTPCGICRQVLREFTDPKDFPVILAKNKNDYKILSLEELLPMSFGPESL